MNKQNKVVIKNLEAVLNNKRTEYNGKLYNMVIKKVAGTLNIRNEFPYAFLFEFEY
jgi:hypothetical protein